MKYRVYQIDLADNATMLIEFSEEDRAKMFRTMMYACDEKEREEYERLGRLVESYRYVIIPIA